MTNKEWLSQSLHIQLEINELEKRLELSYEGNSDGETLAYRDELEYAIERKKTILREIYRAIQGVEDDILRAVLIARYVNCKTLQQISEDMYYSVTHVNRLLRQGEEQIKRG